MTLKELLIEAEKIEILVNPPPKETFKHYGGMFGRRVFTWVADSKDQTFYTADAWTAKHDDMLKKLKLKDEKGRFLYGKSNFEGAETERPYILYMTFTMYAPSKEYKLKEIPKEFSWIKKYT